MPKTTFGPPAAAEAASTLRRYYELGLEAAKVGRYERGAIARIARRKVGGKRPSGDAVRKARRLVQLYPPREFERLLARRNRRTGLPLTWAHLRTLISVPDQAVRGELERAALRESWSSERLIEEVRSRVGRRAAGPRGRKIKRPGSARAAVIKLTRITQSWTRYCADVVDGETIKEKIADLTVPPAEIGTLIAALEELQRVAEAAIGRLRPLPGPKRSRRSSRTSSGQ